jgi:hypothetical protein
MVQLSWTVNLRFFTLAVKLPIVMTGGGTVNAVVAVPSRFVTVIGCDPGASAGTVTVTVVALYPVITAAVAAEPNVTAVTLARLVPVSVICVPDDADAGEIAENTSPKGHSMKSSSESVRSAVSVATIWQTPDGSEQGFATNYFGSAEDRVKDNLWERS